MDEFVYVNTEAQAEILMEELSSDDVVKLMTELYFLLETEKKVDFKRSIS